MEPRHFPYQHPTFGTKKNPAPESAWTDSVYYWWWEYLRRHEEYKQTCENGGQGEFADLYSDFGDVHATDFKAWWRERAVTLFSEPRRDRILSRVEGQISNDDLDNPDLMFVMVPLYLPSKDINKRFAALLKKHHEGKQGVRLARASRAKYPVIGQPNVKALKNTLMAYDLSKVRDAETGKKMTLWRIGIELDGCKGVYVTSEVADRNTLTVIASRYIKKAEAMIRNAGRGRFPDLS